MDFWIAILRLMRRKLIIIPLLGSAIAIALAGYFLTPLYYVSSTTMVLATPTYGGTLSQGPTRPGGLTNPMLNFSSDLRTVTAILINAMNTPEVAAELGAAVRSPTRVTINDGTSNPHLLGSNGPFVYIVCESPSSAKATDVVIRAQQRVRQELVDRQKALGAPPTTYLTIVDVVAPTTPEVDRTQKIKVGGILFVLWFGCGLGIAYAWQRLRANRRKRAAAELPDWESGVRDVSEVAADGSDPPAVVPIQRWSSGDEWRGGSNGGRLRPVSEGANGADFHGAEGHARNGGGAPGTPHADAAAAGWSWSLPHTNTAVVSWWNTDTDEIPTPESSQEAGDPGNAEPGHRP